MSNGFFSTAALLLGSFTLAFGLILAPSINDIDKDCEHKARIFLRDMNSGLLLESLDHNTNISNRISYEEMPESLSFRTEEDIVYSRDDGDIVYGYMTDDEFKSWLRCKKNV